MSKRLVTCLLLLNSILESHATCESNDLLLKKELSDISTSAELKIIPFPRVNLKNLFECKEVVNNRNTLRRKMLIAVDKDDSSQKHRDYTHAITREYLAAESKKFNTCGTFDNYYKVDRSITSKYDDNIFTTSIADENTNNILAMPKFKDHVNNVKIYTINKKKLIIYYKNDKALTFYVKDETTKTNYLIDLDTCPVSTIYTTIVDKTNKSQFTKINCLEERTTENSICRKIPQIPTARLPLLIEENKSGVKIK